MPAYRSTCLGHLHKRKHAFIHPCAAAGAGTYDDRKFRLRRFLYGPRYLLAYDRPHTPHDKAGIRNCQDEFLSFYRAKAADDRLF